MVWTERRPDKPLLISSRALGSTNGGLFGRAKCRLSFSRLTWQGLGNVCIHVCLALFVAYGVCIVAHLIGRRASSERGLLRVGKKEKHEGVKIDVTVHLMRIFRV